jgi:hypothetical protein
MRASMRHSKWAAPASSVLAKICDAKPRFLCGAFSLFRLREVSRSSGGGHTVAFVRRSGDALAGLALLFGSSPIHNQPMMRSPVHKGQRMRPIPSALVAAVLSLLAMGARAEPPHASYIFPAGAQRGTTVKVRVGGHYLHDRAAFEMLGPPGVSAPPEILKTERIWFEGPLIKQPASQAQEDYPQDYSGELAIGVDAPLGARWWRCWNAQGVTPPLPFVVGNLPEVVEEEIAGEPIPVGVTLPLTINGRIFPREDVDIWTFDAAAGQSITCAVAARSLGSPLAARLEVRGPAGERIAESTGMALAEARVRFVAPAAERYAVHITDTASGGLQNYVYRLTVTAGRWIDHVYPLGGRRGSSVRLEAIGQGIDGNAFDFAVPDEDPCVIDQDGFRFDVGDLPEVLEAEPNEALDPALASPAPVVLNGRIQAAGDVDRWWLQLAQGQPLQVRTRVSELGSPLAIVVSLRDEKGQELAKADATTSGAGDPKLAFSPPADGKYLVEIRERFAGRGGPAFAYRVLIAPPQADFQLYAADSIAVDVGAQKNLEVEIERDGDWKAPIKLRAEGLPAGVTCDEVEVAPGTAKAALVFKVAEGTPVVSANLRIVGRAEVDGRAVERVAHWAGDKDRFARGAALPTRLAVTLPTPFKFAGQYSLVYTPRGGVLRKRYAIDRGGYAGPLTAALADRQGRHLQGVTGPVVSIPADATEFEYALQLPPWMELGRTSRTNLMLTGEVQDAAGKVHKVSFTTRDQNEQLIAIVTAAPLRIGLMRRSFAIRPNTELVIPVAIKRDATVTAPIRLELVVPAHMRGISAEPVMVPAGEENASVVVRIGAMPGPINMPLFIRALTERDEQPLTAEAELELALLDAADATAAGE